MTSSQRFLAQALVALVLVGCVKTPGGPPAGTASVGAAGGEVSLGAEAKIVVPAGALAADLAITVARADPAALPALPAGTTLASDVYAFTPHGTQFASPVTVELALTTSTTGDLRVARLDGPDDTLWKVGAAVTVSGDRATFQTDRFSYYAVVGTAAAHCSAQAAGAPSGSASATGMLFSQPRTVVDAFATTSTQTLTGLGGQLFQSQLKITLTGHAAACSYEQAGLDVPSDDIVLFITRTAAAGQPAVPDAPGTYVFTYQSTPVDGVTSATVGYQQVLNSCQATSSKVLPSSTGSIVISASTATEVAGTFTWTMSGQTLSGAFVAPRCAFTGGSATRCCLGTPAPNSDGGVSDGGSSSPDGGSADAGTVVCTNPIAGAPTGSVSTTGMLNSQPRTVVDAYATSSSRVGAGEGGTTYTSQLKIALTGYPSACGFEKAGLGVPSSNIMLYLTASSTVSQPAIPDAPGTYPWVLAPADGVVNASVGYGQVTDACAESGSLFTGSVSGSITISASSATEVSGSFTSTQNGQTLSGTFTAPRCDFPGTLAERCCLGTTSPPTDGGSPKADAGTDAGTDAGVVCSAPAAGSAGSGSATGTWMTQTLTPVDAYVATHVDTGNVWGTYIRWLEFHLTEYSNACGYELANLDRAGGRSLNFRLVQWSNSAPVPDPVPGTYAYAASPPEDTAVFEGAGIFSAASGSCTYGSLHGGSPSGSLTISTIDSTHITGSYTSTVTNLATGTPETMTGTFDAPRCDSPGSPTARCCAP